MLSLLFFSNERYELLKIIYNNQTNVKNDSYATLSQQEIADIAHISKLKANRLINELISENYICYYNNKRGKYSLTQNGYKIIEIFESQYIV